MLVQREILLHLQKQGLHLEFACEVKPKGGSSSLRLCRGTKTVATTEFSKPTGAVTPETLLDYVWQKLIMDERLPLPRPLLTRLLRLTHDAYNPQMACMHRSLGIVYPCSPCETYQVADGLPTAIKNILQQTHPVPAGTVNPKAVTFVVYAQDHECMLITPHPLGVQEHTIDFHAVDYKRPPVYSFVQTKEYPKIHESQFGFEALLTDKEAQSIINPHLLYYGAHLLALHAQPQTAENAFKYDPFDL